MVRLCSFDSHLRDWNGYDYDGELTDTLWGQDGIFLNWLH